MRVLVGIVAYRNLRDLSAPFAILDRLEMEPLGQDVVVEDTSYNPIAVVQWLQAEPPEARPERVILIGAVERGRPPGTVTTWRWDAVLPSDEAVQQAIAEAVTGIISLENTLVIARYFKVLPPEVVVVEIEPLDQAFGATMSAEVSAAIEPACTRIRELARATGVIDELPQVALLLRAPQASGIRW